MPALDGLRGVAILLVVVGHGGLVAHGHASDAGVVLFFALSGYLITGVLLRRPTFRGFYLRRAARLLPALLLMLAVLGVLAAGLGSVFWSMAWPALFYVANWWQASGHDMGSFSHAWSLSIEEQWYLVWPAVVLLVPRRRLPALIVAVIIGSLAARAWFVVGGEQWRAYNGTDTNAFALAAGALLAVVPRRAARWWQPVAVALFAVAACWPSYPPWPHGSAFWVAVLSVTGGVLMVGVAVTGRAPWLCWTPLRYAGTVSYGWYLWHYPLDRVAASVLGNGRLVGMCASVAALGVAALSWRYIEQPILRRVRQAAGDSLRVGRPDVRVRLVDHRLQAVDGGPQHGERVADLGPERLSVLDGGQLRRLRRGTGAGLRDGRGDVAGPAGERVRRSNTFEPGDAGTRQAENHDSHLDGASLLGAEELCLEDGLVGGRADIVSTADVKDADLDVVGRHERDGDRGVHPGQDRGVEAAAALDFGGAVLLEQPVRGRGWHRVPVRLDVEPVVAAQAGRDRDACVVRGVVMEPAGVVFLGVEHK